MALNLPSLDAAQHGLRPNAKPPKRKTLKGRKDRAEAKVEKAVRAQCVDRDGYCRIQKDVAWPVDGQRYTCDGESQWAHMHARRRSQTRGRDPEVRHSSRYSFMACAFHHSEYDAHRLIITARTRKGADGPLKYRRAK